MRSLANIVPEHLNLSTDRRHFEGLLYDHTYRLLGESSYFVDLPNRGSSRFNLDYHSYAAAEMGAFERYAAASGGVTYDYAYADNVQDRLHSKYQKLLGAEYGSDFLKPILTFTIDRLVKFTLIDRAYNDSLNPWLPVADVIQRGYLLFAASDVGTLREYKKDLPFSAQSKPRLGFITKAKKKQLGGFLTDDRYEWMLRILEFLRTESTSRREVRSLRHIQAFIHDTTRESWTKADIQIMITTPLKKFGLIGSNSDGFFVLNDEEDLAESYCFHLSKNQSISRILQKYDNIAKNYRLSKTLAEICEDKQHSSGDDIEE